MEQDLGANPEGSRSKVRELGGTGGIPGPGGFGKLSWEAGIRTPISRSRVCGPTVGRPPKGLSNQLSREGYHTRGVFLWGFLWGLSFQNFLLELRQGPHALTFVSLRQVRVSQRHLRVFMSHKFHPGLFRDVRHSEPRAEAVPEIMPAKIFDACRLFAVLNDLRHAFHGCSSWVNTASSAFGFLRL